MLIKLEVREMTYDATALYWAVEADFNENIFDFGYFVEISESLQGPWSKVNEVPIYGYGFIDRVTQRGMIDQRIYYRVRGVHGDREFSSEPICLRDERNNYISMYIAEQEQMMLEYFNGDECIHLARRKFGKRCQHCYDEIQRKTIRAKCPHCYGTTYEGGFFAPVKIYANFDPRAKAIDKNEHGVTENASLTGWTSNLAIIESDDVIIELAKPSERFIVNHVLPTAMHNKIIKQQLTLTQIRGDHPFHLIPVDFSAYPLEELSVFRREWK